MENIEENNCYICDKSFARHNALVKHLKRVHKVHSQNVENIDLSVDFQLPAQYTYKMYSSQDGCKEVQANLYSEADVENWLKSYSSNTKTTWRVYKTYPRPPQSLLYKKIFKCQHNVKHRAQENSKRSSKGTGCPALVKVTIQKSSDDVCNHNELPAIISLRGCHNHALECAEVLKYRPMSDETQNKLCSLFQEGHNPASALHSLKTDLLLQHEDNYFKIAADGAYVPTLSIVHKLFEKEFAGRYGEISGENMLKSLKEKLEQYSKESGGSAKLCKTEDDQHYFVVICTPLMARVHEHISQASEVVLVDASGGVDKQRHRVYFFVTPTAAGGLPLGAIISDTEKESVFNEAVTQLKTILPEKCFFWKELPRCIPHR